MKDADRDGTVVVQVVWEVLSIEASYRRERLDEDVLELVFMFLSLWLKVEPAVYLLCLSSRVYVRGNTKHEQEGKHTQEGSARRSTNKPWILSHPQHFFPITALGWPSAKQNRGTHRFLLHPHFPQCKCTRRCRTCLHPTCPSGGGEFSALKVHPSGHRKT